MNNFEFNRKTNDITKKKNTNTEFSNELTNNSLHDKKSFEKRDFGDYTAKEMYEMGEEFYKKQKANSNDKSTH